MAPGRAGFGVREIWETDAYAQLVLEGSLANGIPPWGDVVLGAPAPATVRNPSAFPYVSSSSNKTLHSVLEAEWPHAEIFAVYRSVL
jgi:hypothetical protein